MSDAALARAAIAVVAYWDYMDAIPADDPRPLEEFKAEMDRRMNEMRGSIEGLAPTTTTPELPE